MDLMRVHHPESASEACAYLQDWVKGGHGRGLTPLRELTWMLRDLSEAHGPITRRALEPLDMVHTHPVKLVSVTRERKRQKRREASLPEVGDFEAYVARRESQGASQAEAQAEWNGLALLRVAVRHASS